MCHPHQILFKIRFSNLEIERGALDLWYLFIFDIFARSSQDDILDVRKMFKQNDSTKVRSFLKQCLHDLHFMKTRSFLPNLSELAPDDISQAEGPCFHKLKKHRFKNEWILVTKQQNSKRNPTLFLPYRKNPMLICLLLCFASDFGQGFLRLFDHKNIC